jgi:hypothetical protein
VQGHIQISADAAAHGPLDDPSEGSQLRALGGRLEVVCADPHSTLAPIPTPSNHLRAHTHERTHTRTHTHTHTHARTRAHAHTCARAHVRAHESRQRIHVCTSSTLCMSTCTCRQHQGPDLARRVCARVRAWLRARACTCCVRTCARACGHAQVGSIEVQLSRDQCKRLYPPAEGAVRPHLRRDAFVHIYAETRLAHICAGTAQAPPVAPPPAHDDRLKERLAESGSAVRRLNSLRSGGHLRRRSTPATARKRFRTGAFPHSEVFAARLARAARLPPAAHAGLPPRGRIAHRPLRTAHRNRAPSRAFKGRSAASPAACQGSVLRRTQPHQPARTGDPAALQRAGCPWRPPAVPRNVGEVPGQALTRSGADVRQGLPHSGRPRAARRGRSVVARCNAALGARSTRGSRRIGSQTAA